MVEVKRNQMHEISKLFSGIEDSMIIACLQGYGGKAYADRIPAPRVAVIISGEYSFFAGDADLDSAKTFVENLFDYITGNYTVGIYSEEDLKWSELLLYFKSNNPIEVMRYGILQKDYDFDKNKLENYINAIPNGFELKRFDEKLYDQAMGEDWSKEFCETFSSSEDYLVNGFGFGIIKDGTLVSGASSMTVYDGGIEVQVATREDFQRRGFSMACAAALLIECIKRGVRPCWDAATLTSKHMALELGYEYKGEYSTIHMSKSNI